MKPPAWTPRRGAISGARRSGCQRRSKNRPRGGALLITAMLIIPAATARPFSRTPEMMAAMAIIIAGSSVVAGIEASYQLNSPTGPTIVCVVSILFALSVAVSGLARRD